MIVHESGQPRIDGFPLPDIQWYGETRWPTISGSECGKGTDQIRSRAPLVDHADGYLLCRKSL